MLGKCVLHPEGDSFPPIQRFLSCSAALITMDGVGAADLHLYDAGKAPSPAFEELARLGITCHLAFGTAFTTPAAAVSIATGQLPSTHGVLSFDDRLAGDNWTLAELFQRRGFATAAFTNLPLLTKNGLDQGFAVAHEDLAAGADELAAAAAGWLQGLGDRNYFLWVHHHLNPNAAGGRDRDPAVAADRLLGGLLEGLKRARLYEGTFVVAAGTNGRPGGALMVPLVWKIPKRVAIGQIRGGPCSTLDIAATLLDTFEMNGLLQTPGRALNAGSPSPLYSGFYFVDRALFELFEPGDRRTGLGLRGPQYALIHGPHPTQYALFDMARDPRMQKNLATGSDRRIQDAMAKELGERRQRIPKAIPAEKAPLDEPTRAFLRTLGY